MNDLRDAIKALIENSHPLYERYTNDLYKVYVKPEDIQNLIAEYNIYFVASGDEQLKIT